MWTEVRSKLLHMSPEFHREALSLHDLRPSEVPIEHSFELGKGDPIYSRCRRPAQKHNQVVREDLNTITDAGIIRPTSSVWSFPVVIATKWDGTPRFCVDYREINARMKGDRGKIPKIQEIFDELKRGRVFTAMDILSGYWKVRLHEYCKDKTTLICRCGTYIFAEMNIRLMKALYMF